MSKPTRYVFPEDAAIDARWLSQSTGRDHYVYFDPPPWTGPAGACYYVSHDPDDAGRRLDSGEIGGE